MSVPGTTAISQTVTSNAVSSNVTATQTSVGVSSIPDTISSAQQNADRNSSVFKTLSYPFVYIGRAATDAAKSISNFIASTYRDLRMGYSFGFADGRKIIFLEDLINTNALGGALLDRALVEFSHLSKTSTKEYAFSLVQKEASVSPEVTRAFYDLLPVDVQNHIEGHIWLENGKQDNGMIRFGKHVIETDIKNDLVTRAIKACMDER